MSNDEIEFRPLTEWPGTPTPDYRRREAPFKRTTARSWGTDRRMPVGRTITQLKGELEKLRAKNTMILMDCDASQIRKDGWPRSGARVRGPGVILTFDSQHGPLSYPCDTFTRWEDNLRAITLALEALRTVDRYGVTKRGEQYTGWKALPGAGESSTTMTAQQAAQYIAQHASPDENGGHWSEAAVIVVRDQLLKDPTTVSLSYRNAARRLHPDSGGSHDAMATLSVAKRILEQHHARR